MQSPRDVLTPNALSLLQSVADAVHAKLEAQLRGLGGGFLPEPMARLHLNTGRLVLKQVERASRTARMHYAWRSPRLGPGRALQWWLGQLESRTTRDALLSAHEAVW